MGSIKKAGNGVAEAFEAGYKAARRKTGVLMTREFTPAQKCIILGAVLALGVVIGLLIAKIWNKDRDYDYDDFEEFEAFED
ncbi:MAG: hypothetical protein Q4B73_08215 [Lachnospiraceae bacterium]|nr:hypothetical protein [Lachnospiraceae bacterium]